MNVILSMKHILASSILRESVMNKGNQRTIQNNEENYNSAPGQNDYSPDVDISSQNNSKNFVSKDEFQGSKKEFTLNAPRTLQN